MCRENVNRAIRNHIIRGHKYLNWPSLEWGTCSYGSQKQKADELQFQNGWVLKLM